MLKFIYFATYHLVDFSPIPPSQVTSSTLQSIRCCSSPVLPADISAFFLHSASVPGRKRNTRTAKTVNCLHHAERRMRLRLNQTHCAARISKEEGGRGIWGRGAQVLPHRGRNNKVPENHLKLGGWAAWEKEMWEWAASKKCQIMWIIEGKQDVIEDIKSEGRSTEDYSRSRMQLSRG